MYQLYPRDVLEVIIDKFDEMEMICELAKVNGFFYNLLRLDFKKLCIRNNIYRRPGELWSDAFKELPKRHFSFWHNTCTSCNVVWASENSDRVLAVGLYHVTIFSLDLEKGILQTIKCESKIKGALIDPKGEIVEVFLDDGLHVFDVLTGKRLAVVPTEPNIVQLNYGLFNKEDRSFFNTSDQRWCGVKGNEMTEVDTKVSGRCNSHYAVFRVESTQIYVINCENGAVDKLADLPRGRFSLMYLNDGYHLMISSDVSDDIRIYDLHSRCCVFKNTSASKDRWHKIVGQVIGHTSGKIAVFNEKMNTWTMIEGSECDFWPGSVANITPLNGGAKDITCVETILADDMSKLRQFYEVHVPTRQTYYFVQLNDGKHPKFLRFPCREKGEENDDLVWKFVICINRDEINKTHPIAPSLSPGDRDKLILNYVMDKYKPDRTRRSRGYLR